MEPSALDDLYRELGAALAGRPSATASPCGDCFTCCTAAGLTQQNVSAMEFDLLEQRHGARRAAAFRIYTERVRDAEGRFVHEICPYYDVTAKGCGVYADRPYSCRVFGHYRMTGTRLPDPCVYQDLVAEVASGAYFREVPLARRLRDLQRRYESHRPQALGTSATGAALDPQALLERVRRNVDADDPVDLALLAQMEGRREDALALMEQAVATDPDDAWLHLSRGNLLDELGRSADAGLAYERSLQLDPDNPRAWSHLGFTRIEAGQVVPARDAFAHAVRLHPQDPLARGFLGYLTLASATSMAEVRAAGEHLQVAVRHDPANPVYALRLSEALLLQGRVDDAMAPLRAASTDARTASAADGVRQRFAHLLAPP